MLPWTSPIAIVAMTRARFQFRPAKRIAACEIHISPGRCVRLLHYLGVYLTLIKAQMIRHDVLSLDDDRAGAANGETAHIARV